MSGYKNLGREAGSLEGRGDLVAAEAGECRGRRGGRGEGVGHFRSGRINWIGPHVQREIDLMVPGWLSSSN